MQTMPALTKTGESHMAVDAGKHVMRSVPLTS